MFLLLLWWWLLCFDGSPLVVVEVDVVKLNSMQGGWSYHENFRGQCSLWLSLEVGTLIVRLAEQPHGVSHGEVTLLAYRFVPVL